MYDVRQDMDAGLAYGLFELLLALIIIVLPIVISYFIFYHISKKKTFSAIASITGIIVTLILGYGAGLFWAILGLTGASDFPLAPIVMSISMIAGTALIGFAVVKLLDKNIHV